MNTGTGMEVYKYNGVIKSQISIQRSHKRRHKELETTGEIRKREGLKAASL